MVLIEDITDTVEGGIEDGSQSAAELRSALRALSARLALPEELLPSFLEEDKPVEALRMYQDHSLSLLRQIDGKASSPAWSALLEEEQAELVFEITRLYGDDAWSSDVLRDTIDSITTHVDRPAIALHLLGLLRPLFASNPHPMLNATTSRALPRPAGGQAAQADFVEADAQRFKSAGAWGCHNILSWAASHLSPSELEKRIGLVLPPTLTMMDDWEPAWRGRGVRVLNGWIDRMSPETMRRMGIDKLLRDSLAHTMSLHSSPPLPGVLEVAIKLVDMTTDGKARAEALSDLVEKGIVHGWMYAPSGKEGRAVLIGIGRDLETMCGVMGEGIVRWMKAIVPNLLGPLQYMPTSAVLPHYEANLSALLCVIRTVSATGRAARWRGQILDVVSRLAVQLAERGDESENDRSSALRQLIEDLYDEIKRQTPGVVEHEYTTLQATGLPAFAGLVAAK